MDTGAERDPHEWLRFLFRVLSAFAEHGDSSKGPETSISLSARWGGPDSPSQLETRVRFLAESLNLIPKNQWHLASDVSRIWQEAVECDEGASFARLSELSQGVFRRPLAQATGDESHQRELRNRLLLALGFESTEGLHTSKFDSPEFQRTHSVLQDELDPSLVSAVDIWLSELQSPAWQSTSSPFADEDDLPLREIYVDLLAVPVDEVSEFESRASGSHRQQARRFQRSQSATLSIPQVLSRTRDRAIIVGEPGAGKSTLVKWIANAILQGELHDFDFPIVIRLSQFAAHSAKNDQRSILSSFFQTLLDCEPSIAEALASSLRSRNADRRRVLLLLDGWDEVPAVMRDVIREHIVTESRYFVTIITTRPSGVPRVFRDGDKSTFYELAGLSMRSIDRLARRLLEAWKVSGLHASLMEQFSVRPDMAELMGNPFLHTLICRLWWATQGSQLPRSRAQLFEHTVKWLEEQYNHERSQGDRFDHSHWEMLAELSHELLFTGPVPQYTFRKLQLDDIANRSNTTTEPVVHSRLVNQVLSSLDEYSFVHATFEEYFASRHLRTIHTDDREQLLRLILWDQARVEVMLFAAGETSFRNSYWRVVRELANDPDRFQQVNRLCSRLVAAGAIPDGGVAELGFDVRERLWSAITEPDQDLRLVEECVLELVSLDARDLVRRSIRDALKVSDWVKQCVLLHAPRSVALSQGLYQTAEQVWKEHFGLENNNAVSEAELAQQRKILGNPRTDAETLLTSIIRLGNCCDREAVPALKELLDRALKEQSDVGLIEQLIYSLAQIAGRDSVEYLVHLVFDSRANEVRAALEMALRQDGYSALDPEGRDEILRRVAMLPPDDYRIGAGLEVLSGLPLQGSIDLLLSIISDQSALFENRVNAARLLSGCKVDDQVGALWSLLIEETDPNVQIALLSALQNAPLRLDVSQLAWIKSRVLDLKFIAEERQTAMRLLLMALQANGQNSARDIWFTWWLELFNSLLAERTHELTTDFFLLAEYFPTGASTILLDKLQSRQLEELDDSSGLRRKMVDALGDMRASDARTYLLQVLDDSLQNAGNDVLEVSVSKANHAPSVLEPALLAYTAASSLTKIAPLDLLDYPSECRPVAKALCDWSIRTGNRVFEDRIADTTGKVMGVASKSRALESKKHRKSSVNYPLKSGFEYHVFLSHNSKDKPAIKKLKELLESKGIRCWYDVDELQPGVPWQPLLEEGIRKSQSVIVAIADSGLGQWQDEEMQAALIFAGREKRPVIPLLLPGSSTKPKLPVFLVIRTWVDLRAGYDDPGIKQLLWGITGRKVPSDDGENLEIISLQKLISQLIPTVLACLACAICLLFYLGFGPSIIRNWIGLANFDEKGIEKSPSTVPVVVTSSQGPADWLEGASYSVAGPSTSNSPEGQGVRALEKKIYGRFSLLADSAAPNAKIPASTIVEISVPAGLLITLVIDRTNGHKQIFNEPAGEESVKLSFGGDAKNLDFDVFFIPPTGSGLQSKLFREFPSTSYSGVKLKVSGKEIRRKVQREN